MDAFGVLAAANALQNGGPLQYDTITQYVLKNGSQWTCARHGLYILQFIPSETGAAQYSILGPNGQSSSLSTSSIMYSWNGYISIANGTTITASNQIPSNANGAISILGVGNAGT